MTVDRKEGLVLLRVRHGDGWMDPDTLVATSMSHDHSCFQDEVIKLGQ